ncbi:MAG: TetR/AcrR family transcriptional regulator [Chloroflexaceae bacterium]|jgi:AcrR family transcriptional regulator|nr:TetR/AcrR family transcriptional regulator [Chloroflexaceae bacterium]
MVQTRRERQFSATQDEIKGIARQHMAAEGTAALSLRAIARDMGMTAPALYRYYPDRDALITALILDAYYALANAMRAATNSRPTTAYADRLYAALICYRDWAMAHPTEFQLIFGNPIPGYQAPPEQTTPAARSVGMVVIETLLAAHRAGALHIPAIYHEVPPLRDAPALYLAAAAAPNAQPALTSIYLSGWSLAHGLVLLEMFHHTTPLLPDPAAFYRFEVLAFMRNVGLEPTDTS